MDITFQTASGGAWEAACTLVFLPVGRTLAQTAPTLTREAPWTEISPGAGDFRGKKDEQVLIFGHPDLPLPRVLLCGLGDKPDMQGLRLAVAQAVRRCREQGLDTLGLSEENLADLSAFLGLELPVLLKEVAVAAQVCLYRCEEYRGRKAEAPAKDPRRLTLLTTAKVLDDNLLRAVREGEAEAAGVVLARRLVNGPANIITPEFLAQEAEYLAARHKFRAVVYDPEQIRALGMGALLFVAKGARREPRFITLEHCPAGAENDAPLVLVGKGITFDTGGISLKPALKMHEMKGDMGGAAAILGFFEALGRMPDRTAFPRVIGLIPACENMPGGNAGRPGDVVGTKSGITVEVLNTDAEGRLILCDALTYAQQVCNPKAVVDIATLTGACVVALGDLGAGVFTRDKELRGLILDAAEACGELYWPLPLWKEYNELLKSDTADVANVGPREGGAINAALFLDRFVENGTRWAHLDIAGPGYVTKTTPLSPVPGGTGTGVRIFCSLARGLR